MAPRAPQNSIWAQMNYTPPRGSCNHKESLLSPKCPCLRFMLHPLKVSTSFECDGCSHHASFHNMSSPADDAILARWASEDRDQQQQQPASCSGTNAIRRASGTSHTRKRRRAIEPAPASGATAGPSTTIHDAHDATIHVDDDAHDNDARVLGSDDAAYPVHGIEPEELETVAEAMRRTSRTWGDRFSGFGFGREEEPVKTPPKKGPSRATERRAARRRGVGGSGGAAGPVDVYEVLSDTEAPD